MEIDMLLIISRMAISLLLSFLSILVVVAYMRTNYPSNSIKALSVAIVIAFTFAAVNSLYWQVIGPVSVLWGVYSRTEVVFIGSILDIVFKGGTAFAAYLHLKSLYLSLPKKERDGWSSLSMAFYPYGFIPWVKCWFTKKGK